VSHGQFADRLQQLGDQRWQWVNGSSWSTDLSGSRVSTRDPLTHDQVNKIPRTGYFVAVMMFDFESTSTLWSWLETAIVGSHESWVVVSHGSRVNWLMGHGSKSVTHCHLCSDVVWFSARWTSGHSLHCIGGTVKDGMSCCDAGLCDRWKTTEVAVSVFQFSSSLLQWLLIIHANPWPVPVPSAYRYAAASACMLIVGTGLMFWHCWLCTGCLELTTANCSR